MERKKSKWIAALLAVFLGVFGAHKFYLNHPKLGITYLAITFGTFAILVAVFGQSDDPPGWVGLFNIAAWLGIVEGILYAVKSQEKFESIYVEGRKAIF